MRGAGRYDKKPVKVIRTLDSSGAFTRLEAVQTTPDPNSSCRMLNVKETNERPTRVKEVKVPDDLSGIAKGDDTARIGVTLSVTMSPPTPVPLIESFISPTHLSMVYFATDRTPYQEVRHWAS